MTAESDRNAYNIPAIFFLNTLKSTQLYYFVVRQQRIDLIRKIEKQTNSKILVYITGDRGGLESQISSDVIPFIYRHLEKIGQTSKINLLIYTTGGIAISGYGIVNMIREHCSEYGVIIPFKCLSTGTLMALGANSIIMSKMGQLGPVDPSLTHPLGPAIQTNPTSKELVPVNVEDVVSFFDLAKKEAKTNSEEELTKIMTILSAGIHPLVLGAVNRTRNEIRFLAKTLLKQHMTDEKKIDSIVKTLIEERFSHNYIISRKEAKDLKLNIVDVSDELMSDIMKLYDEYNKALNLDSPYNFETELDGKDEVTSVLPRCIIEDNNLTHVYSTKVKINRVRIADPSTGIQNTQYQSRILREQWLQDES